jgi:hypothetical protein
MVLAALDRLDEPPVRPLGHSRSWLARLKSRSIAAAAALPTSELTVSTALPSDRRPRAHSCQADHNLSCSSPWIGRRGASWRSPHGPFLSRLRPGLIRRLFVLMLVVVVVGPNDLWMARSTSPHAGLHQGESASATVSECRADGAAHHRRPAGVEEHNGPCLTVISASTCCVGCDQAPGVTRFSLIWYALPAVQLSWALNAASTLPTARRICREDC